VASKYVASFRQIAREEIARLKIDARESRLLKRWRGEDAAALPEFVSVLKRSERLSQVYAMRAELEALWARSTASREQLLQQLQDWIRRAEASGIRQLEEFSLRLRRYAV
jgi:stearoyl-CoA desaturase (delta-9 desaturase)